MTTLPSAPSHRSLPLPLTPLIGREYELLDVTDLLCQPSVRLVTLVGAGGVGKTRLALQVAENLRSYYRDGVCFVPLEGLRDPELLLSTVAQKLGVRDTGVGLIYEELVGVLGTQEVLLVLDNLEHLSTAASLLSALMRDCPFLTVLVTSRTPLGVYGEREYPVAPLPLPERDSIASGHHHRWMEYAAVRLFVDRAIEVRPTFRLTHENAQDVVEICRRLDGLPLAIELAAARLKVLSPEALLQRLARRLDMLTGGARGRPSRFQTMRDTISWSYELLSEDQRRLFRRLGVFAGGFTLEAVVAVEERIEPGSNERQASSDDALGVLDRVSELLDHSLIHHISHDDPEPRFAMYQTIQEFAQELLIHHQELDTIQRAHAEYMAHLAEQAEPELTGECQLTWLDRLEAEHDNIRAALDWAIAAGNARLAQRIVSPLWRFCWIRGLLHEGREWFARALTLGDSELTPERTRTLFGAGHLADSQGDYEQAIRLYREALPGARQLGDQRLVAQLLDALANVAHDRGRYDEAIQLHEEARNIFGDLGDQRGMAGCLHNIATVHYYRSDLDAADALYMRSLELLRAIGDQRNIGNVLGSLGSIAHAKGETERARQLHEQSRDVLRSTGDEIGIALSDINLGIVCFELGNYEEARALSQSALDACLKLGAKRFAAAAQDTLGRIARADGEPGEAAQHLAQSLTTFVELGNLAQTAECLELLGGLAATLREPIRGVRLMAAADAIRSSTGARADPSHREKCEEDMKVLRRACAEDAFTDAWTAGSAEPMDAIMAEVLELSELAATAPADRVVLAAAEDLGLSRREVEVLRLFAGGYTSQQIAETLAISPTAVTSHIGNLHMKLGAGSRAELAAFAFQSGLV